MDNPVNCNVSCCEANFWEGSPTKDLSDYPSVALRHIVLVGHVTFQFFKCFIVGKRCFYRSVCSVRHLYLPFPLEITTELIRYVCTTVIDGIKDNMGRCSTGSANTKLLCRAEGGKWKWLMDISGQFLDVSNIISGFFRFQFSGEIIILPVFTRLLMVITLV